MEPFPVPASSPAESASPPGPQDPPRPRPADSLEAGTAGASATYAEAAARSDAEGVRLPPPPQLISGTWVALLGWLVPGLGQMVTGRVGAGLALLVVLGSLFAGGLALTDFSAVDPRTYKLEFIAQALIGGPTALALRFTEDVRLERLPPWREVGSLYMVVAGFLNLIAICGATSDAQRRNVAARARHAAAVLEALQLACARSVAQRPAWVPAPSPPLPEPSSTRRDELSAPPAPTPSEAPPPPPPVALDPAGPP